MARSVMHIIPAADRTATTTTTTVVVGTFVSGSGGGMATMAGVGEPSGMGGMGMLTVHSASYL
jgi:hypothetical protein